MITNIHGITRTIVTILLAICCAFTTTAEAACDKRCKKLKRAPVIGITRTKEYLQSGRDMIAVKGPKAAKQMGYTRARACPTSSRHKPRLARAATPGCAPAILSTRDAVFFCPKQVRRFPSVARAEAKGYTAYTGCAELDPLPSATPTPTATPATTPLPSLRSYTAEDGVRLSDLDGASIVTLNSGVTRAYISASYSSFDAERIYYADAADGLTFGSRVAVSGLTPGTSSETLANTSVTILADGSMSMIYEKSRHISSAGLDIHSLMRAVSVNGTAFSNSPATIIIENGSAISNPFYADVVVTATGTQRMYYAIFSTIYSTVSSDQGATWTDEGAIAILGRSDSYAPYPNGPSVIRLDNGSYMMFFASPPTITDTKSTIYSAESNDGRTFYVHDTPLITPSTETSYTDPSAVSISGGGLRIYYVARNGDAFSGTRELKSIISPP